MKISFLVAAHNEVATVRQVLDRIRALELDAQIVVVDDGSSDGTAEAVESWRAEHGDVVLLQEPHRGKGAAIRRALEHAEGEITVIQDADMEYDPADVPALIEPIERGVADVVFGSRLLGGRPQRAYLFWHLAGNRVLLLPDQRALQHDDLAPTTDGRMRRGRRSRGETASRRPWCSSRCGFGARSARLDRLVSPRPTPGRARECRSSRRPPGRRRSPRADP